MPTITAPVLKGERQRREKGREGGRDREAFGKVVKKLLGMLVCHPGVPEFRSWLCS